MYANIYDRYSDQDSSIDAIPIGFVDVFFSTGGLPEINLANVSAISCHGFASNAC